MTQRTRLPEMDTSPERPRPQGTESRWVLAPESEPHSHEHSHEKLVGRYRRHRDLNEDPFDPSSKPGTFSSGYRDAHMKPRQPARFHERQRTPQEPAPVPTAARSLSLGQTFAIAALMALISGAGVGFLNARLMPVPVQSQPDDALAAEDQPIEGLVQLETVEAKPAQKAAPVQPAPGATEDTAAQSTVIQKKPVPTATLQVADVAGVTNSFIPLALHAEPASLDSGMLLKISGVPEGAYLTSGRREDDQIWALTLDDLKGLKLVVPEAQQPEIDLAVAAFEPRTGELAAPVKTMTVALADVVVQPASAPPPQQTMTTAKQTPTGKSGLPEASQEVLPAAIPAPESVSLALNTPHDAPKTNELLTEGDALLKNGDVRAARTAYEQVWSGGSAAGAFGIARTHDPVVLGSLYLKNAKPDKAQALAWYERAASAGHPEAAAAIVRLRLKP